MKNPLCIGGKDIFLGLHNQSQSELNRGTAYMQVSSRAAQAHNVRSYLLYLLLC